VDEVQESAHEYLEMEEYLIEHSNGG
jgi:hypothetical protein